MINLLKKECWEFETPWGTIINPDILGKEIAITPDLVTFNDNFIVCRTNKSNWVGWKKDKEWNTIITETEWGVGSCIARDIYRTHFGKYIFKFKLPKYRGSWPAIWLIDMLHESKGGMGMPPEIDIMEHFRKDKFFSRFHITGTYHGGATYQSDIQIQKKFRKYFGLYPVDIDEIEIEFNWTDQFMNWIVNGKEKLRIPNTVQRYPMKPMNLIIGAGIGLDWKPENSSEPFIVTKAEYYSI